MPELLEELRRDHEFLEQLDFIKPHCAQVFWIREFVLCCSGRLLVLHPTSQSGVWIQYQNVGTCFQLFSLLQLAIGEGIQGGAPSNPEVAAVFNGQSQQVLRDQAWWHYEEVNTYSQSGFYKLWGGGKVRWISKLDEQQILVLSPPILPTLTWEIPSPFPAKIPASVMIERYLEPEECQAWLRKLAQLREGREEREIQARSQLTTKPNSLSRDLLPYGIPIFLILLGLLSHIAFRNSSDEIDNPPLLEQASQSQQKSVTLAPSQELWQVEDFVLLEKIPTYGGYPKYFHLKLFASGKVEMRGDAKLCISAPVVYAEVDAAKVKHIMQTLQGLQFYSLPNYSAVEKEDTADLSITFQQSNRQHRIAINRKALNFPSMIGQLEQEIERVVEAPKLLEKISASEKVCFTNK